LTSEVRAINILRWNLRGGYVSTVATIDHAQRVEPGVTLIQSLQRGLRLLEEVGEMGRAHAKQLALRTGIALPTTYHLLRTLVHDGYLARLDDGSYTAGPQLHAVAGHDLVWYRVPRVRGLLRQLRDDNGASVYLAAYEHGEITLADVLESPKVPKLDAWVGSPVPAHATALGKCVLANLSEFERAAYLERHPLKALTAKTIVDMKRLDRELETRSLASDRQECFYGIGCVAAPILAPRVLGAISIAMPLERLRAREPRIAAVVEETAAQISRSIVDSA
jgi:IclR family acetate operon transcriptional repressor